MNEKSMHLINIGEDDNGKPIRVTGWLVGPVETPGQSAFLTFDMNDGTRQVYHRSLAQLIAVNDEDL